MRYNISEPDKAYDKCHHLLSSFKSNETSHFIKWTSPFSSSGLLSVVFHSYSNFNRSSCKQTVENLIRLCILWRLILACTDCLRPTKKNASLIWVNTSVLHWPKMKTLHFISLNKCFVSIHVVVRFTHAYRDFVAENDYEIFIQIPGLFKYQRLKNVFRTLHVLRNRWFINSFKTDKKVLVIKNN